MVCVTIIVTTPISLLFVSAIRTRPRSTGFAVEPVAQLLGRVGRVSAQEAAAAGTRTVLEWSARLTAPGSRESSWKPACAERPCPSWGTGAFPEHGSGRSPGSLQPHRAQGLLSASLSSSELSGSQPGSVASELRGLQPIAVTLRPAMCHCASRPLSSPCPSASPIVHLLWSLFCHLWVPCRVLSGKWLPQVST